MTRHVLYKQRAEWTSKGLSGSREEASLHSKHLNGVGNQAFCRITNCLITDKAETWWEKTYIIYLTTSILFP
jgi:hypothetical protein